ncbi:hypothetical protein CGL51_14340 [Pyrobaculum aerophilum]|uniref:Uncharacterized protein n=1 Tax=Pyrobaculum aerophilum TaxID=13773 RepID=A0A371R6N4_9CREN|nr:hypothetical protein CGL51_14340 [Pyrobaculum aerophilum]RFB00156.1 hypothetical protein CGL52_02090 [Pyrobaculum aerophilum]
MVSLFFSTLYFLGLEEAIASVRLPLLSVVVFAMVFLITYKLAGRKAGIAVAALMFYIVMPLVLELKAELPLLYAGIALAPIATYLGLRGNDTDRKIALLANELFLAYVVLLVASYLLGLAPPSA